MIGLLFKAFKRKLSHYQRMADMARQSALIYGLTMPPPIAEEDRKQLYIMRQSLDELNSLAVACGNSEILDAAVAFTKAIETEKSTAEVRRNMRPLLVLLHKRFAV